ncbi:MAG: TetR/AcrR family transcriptional regulator [Myxococcota bacterium]
MGRPRSDKRERVIDAATALVYEQGFHRTSLADVSRASHVPLGNLSYYFRTKEALGGAVVERIASAWGAMRERWEAHEDPRERLLAFVQMSVERREALALHGCPVGTLCAELHKEPGGVAEQAAAVFGELLGWLEAQFVALGRADDAGDLAVHLLSAVEGASLLTLTFHDPSHVVREARVLEGWLRTL